MSFSVLDLFSGIGGFHLGIEKAKLQDVFETRLFVEKDLFCQKVLRNNFPSIPIYNDIRNLEPNKNSYDIIAASPPCPPFSCAGKQLAENDERDLFPEVLRLINQVKPKGIIIENVSQLISVNEGQYFKSLISKIAKNGYICEWGIYAVSDLGGVHRRKRCFIVAYSDSINSKRNREISPQTWAANPSISSGSASNQRTSQSGICRSHDGLSFGMDGLLTGIFTPTKITNLQPNHKKRLFALGNAICPHQAAIAWKVLYSRIT